MTATTSEPTATPTTSRRSGLLDAWSDTATIVQRNLITIRRVPQLLVFSTIQPVIFVLMFRYVFGGSIRIPGVPYVDYLMPGIFAQTIAFGAINTGIGLADDMSKGLIERFRSLPMARSAVLVGRTMADVLRNVFVQALMVAVGFLVGFRFHQGVLRLGLAFALLLFLGFALSWVFGLVGLFTKNPETTQAAAFPVMAPLVFASNAFVDPKYMPSWLRGFARHEPLSVTISAVRRLILTPGQGNLLGLASTRTLVVQSLVWSIAIVAVFAPVAIARYRKVD